MSSSTLSDTQLVLLSAASQRDDLLLTPPQRLVGGARAKVAATLLKRGLVVEVTVGLDRPAWRSDAGDRLGLRITPAGLAALGLEPADDEAEATDRDRETATPTTIHPPAPRSSSKAALVLGLLARPVGATLDQLVAATGWQSHTTRAALTGLRKKGHPITRHSQASGRSVYRLAPTEA